MATLTTAGAIPATPQELRDTEIAIATSLSSGLTANLPASLVEDISSTAAGALVIQDQAFVDLINSISPYTANAFLLYQLGAVYGVEQGRGSNTSVYVTFSGNVGYIIPRGFVVSDGNHQYRVQDGGIIPDSGVSSPLFCIATSSGSWAVPANTVTTLVTSIPSGFIITCTNQSAGITGATTQSLESYQAQVIQGGLATAIGVPNFIRVNLGRVTGVQPNLVAVRSLGSNQWQIICGGGDPYQTAYAIFNSVPDISVLVGSTLSVAGITNSTFAVVTTDQNHGYASGQVAEINGANGMTEINGVPFVVTVIDEKTFSTDIDSTGFGTWTDGGVVTPNLKNQLISVYDYPDTYEIPFVVPPAQTIEISLTWNTIFPNYVAPDSVAQLAQPPIASYINNTYVGQPINIFEIQNLFQNSVSSIIPPNYISKIDIIVTINGIPTSPASGTGIVYGDSESYFSTSNALITIVEG